MNAKMINPFKAFLVISILTIQLQAIAQVKYLDIGYETGLVDSMRDDYFNRLKSKNKSLLSIANTFIIFRNDTFSIISPAERAISLFIIGDFDEILVDIKHGLDFHYRMPKRVFKAKFHRQLFLTNDFGLIQELDSQNELLIKEINQSNLQVDEKYALQLYLRSIMAYTNLKDFDVTQMLEDIAFFLNNYQNSDYAPFVDNVLNIKGKSSLWGFGVGLYSGSYINKGDVSTYIKDYIPIGANFDVGFKKLMLKIAISPSFNLMPRESFTYNGVNWSADSTIFAFNFSGSLGYKIIEGNKIRITPHLGLGRTSLHMNNSSKLSFNSTFNYAVDIDWKFRKVNFFGNYYETFDSYRDKTNFYVRLRLGYSRLDHSDLRFQGDQIYFLIGLGVFSNPNIRLKSRE